ncbi:MAG: hypothetical protein HGGPFJEG_02280 [Ignavibacteria bacterium]|nr:hypothetical protein [Ignavibacteria bacterium]
MFKTAIITGLVLIMSQLNINSGILSQTITSLDNKEKFSLEILPVNEDNLCLIKFNLEQECFVKIKVTDMSNNETEYLLDEEMLPGTYTVYYKSKEKLNTEMYNCSFEVYNSEKEIIYSKELIIHN